MQKGDKRELRCRVRFQRVPWDDRLPSQAFPAPLSTLKEIVCRSQRDCMCKVPRADFNLLALSSKWAGVHQDNSGHFPRTPVPCNLCPHTLSPIAVTLVDAAMGVHLVYRSPTSPASPKVHAAGTIHLSEGDSSCVCCRDS